MQRCTIAALALLAGACSATAAELEIRSTIESVVVYPDGAAVTRVIRTDLPRGDSTLIGRDFPLTLDPSSLRVEGESGARMVIGSIDARTPKPEPAVSTPELEKKIEALRDERAVLDDKIAAETARKTFAQRFGTNVPLGLGEKAEARPITEWRAAFVAIAEEITAADNNIRAARLKQRDIDRQLAILQNQQQANPPRKMEVRIDLASDAAASATLRVTYTVRGARWVPLYDARLDTGTKERKPALELVRRAEIVQQTGEDWVDVALSVSTVRTAKGGNAPELVSLLVRYPVPVSGGFVREYGRNPAGTAAPSPPSQRDQARLDYDTALKIAAQEQEATVDSGGFQAVFRVPGKVSVGASEGAKSFRIGSSNTAPELMVRAAPARDRPRARAARRAAQC